MKKKLSRDIMKFIANLAVFFYLSSVTCSFFQENSLAEHAKVLESNDAGIFPKKGQVVSLRDSLRVPGPQPSIRNRKNKIQRCKTLSQRADIPFLSASLHGECDDSHVESYFILEDKNTPHAFDSHVENEDGMSSMDFGTKLQQELYEYADSDETGPEYDSSSEELNGYVTFDSVVENEATSHSTNLKEVSPEMDAGTSSVPLLSANEIMKRIRNDEKFEITEEMKRNEVYMMNLYEATRVFVRNTKVSKLSKMTLEKTAEKTLKMAAVVLDIISVCLESAFFPDRKQFLEDRKVIVEERIRFIQSNEHLQRAPRKKMSQLEKSASLASKNQVDKEKLPALQFINVAPEDILVSTLPRKIWALQRKLHNNERQS